MILSEEPRCTEMTLGRAQWSFAGEQGNEPSGSAKTWEFIKRRAT